MTKKTASELNKLFSKRLKEVRQAAGLSQRRLGILAGLDIFVASPRINRYEQGTHQPNIAIVHDLAEILEVPAAYFYTDDDFLAQILLLAHKIKPEQREQALELIGSLSDIKLE